MNINVEVIVHKVSGYGEILLNGQTLIEFPIHLLSPDLLKNMNIDVETSHKILED